MLECGHPTECLDDDDECEWCDQVADLSRSIEDLKACIGKQAITLHSGSCVIYGEIGLLTMYGGQVFHQGPTAAVTDSVG